VSADDIIAIVGGLIGLIVTIISSTFYLATRIERIGSVAKTTNDQFARHETQCDERWVRLGDRLENYNRQLGELARVNFSYRPPSSNP